MSTTARRSSRARRTARATSASAVAGPCTRSTTAPTASTRPPWSMRKLDCSAADGVSAASSTTGVRLLAASVRPVIALVSPGPWCTLQAASRPLTRAYPSAMHIAPVSWRADQKRAPASRSALVKARLPLPSRPNTASTPSAGSARPTASATSMAPQIKAGRGASPVGPGRQHTSQLEGRAGACSVTRATAPFACRAPAR